ncbi:MAG: glutamate synthase subunit beta [Oscillospiraceae bacterium]|jgi:glutamate synthase (NADPH/NADH) small chain|nr:glutamate synthase subunit beta [Oscillospiraceae bacterium]
MGKTNACLTIPRITAQDRSALSRSGDFLPFHKHLTLDEQRRQASRCMDCGVPFCHAGRILNGMATGCPLGNLIPEFNDLLYRGAYRQALMRLLLTNPLPEFTGRVCPAPCEQGCMRAFPHENLSKHPLINTPVKCMEAITIRENELTLVEMGFENGWIAPIDAAPNGKSAAVIGAGPAGLACAIRLREYGYSVDIYEKADKPGGLLMYGIPHMKLEKQAIDRRVKWMERSGIKFHLSHEVRGLSELGRKYDAVVVCVGSGQPRDLSVSGRSLKGIEFAVDYLTESTKSVLAGAEPSVTAKGKDVVILGGGDTGNDCVATAIRQGAKSVTQLEIMKRPPDERLPGNPWPEWARTLKTDYGQQEAEARFGADPRIYEAATREFVGDEAVSQVVADVAGVQKTYPAQLVLLAMGFVGVSSGLAESLGVQTTERGAIQTDGYRTSMDGVYACGDARRGQSLVVWAVREGCECAKAAAGRP